MTDYPYDGYRSMTDYYTDDYYYERYTLSPSEIRETLLPLIEHIKGYDNLRIRLERKGGRLGDLGIITEHLSIPVSLKDRYGKNRVSLSDQKGLFHKISDIDFNLHLDIRQTSSGLPVYYLSRIRKDYWDDYSLIVEDLYMSPGYPVADERFIKFMMSGHEVYYLRLSQFRETVATMANLKDDDRAGEIDTVLYDLGRHIFQAAWHDDQRLATMVAGQLGLPVFHNAMELLYLSLSGELCELRGITDENILKFFEEGYPQPAIRDFLRMLNGLDGGMLNNLPQKASDLYKKLIRAFSKFMTVEVTWGPRRLNLPLWKLMCGNYSRPTMVSNELRKKKPVIEATRKLEKAAQVVIDSILEEQQGNSVTSNNQAIKGH